MVIDKYKRLIYSMPVKYGLAPEDAADIFQAVCLELFSELPNLRRAESLKAWLMSITAHKCLHWKKQRRTMVELDEHDPVQAEAMTAFPAHLMEEVEREQGVREAIARLPARCAKMIRLLFYEQPPIPYADVARRLGLATGSIGFIRGRCLKRLQKLLEKMGI